MMPTINAASSTATTAITHQFSLYQGAGGGGSVTGTTVAAVGPAIGGVPAGGVTGMAGITIVGSPAGGRGSTGGTSGSDIGVMMRSSTGSVGGSGASPSGRGGYHLPSVSIHHPGP